MEYSWILPIQPSWPVQLNHEVTAKEALDGGYDTVIVATGSTPKVFSLGDDAHTFTAAEVLLGQKDCGERTVVIGGGLVGCETALWLAQFLVADGQDHAVADNILPAVRTLHAEHAVMIPFGLRPGHHFDSVVRDQLFQHILVRMAQRSVHRQNLGYSCRSRTCRYS